MFFNYDNTVTIETAGKNHFMSAVWALADIVEGKALVEGGCIRPIGRACKPLSEGLTLFLADDPGEAPDTDISIIPFLSDDGRALLKIVCHSVQDDVSADVEEKTSGREDAPLGDDEEAIYDDDLPF